MNPPPSLVQLIYLSTVNVPLSEKQLHGLLEQARRNNKLHGITGLLLYNSGDFIQVIEGNAEDVEQLFKNITADKRHSCVIKLSHEKITKRFFTGWLMNFQNLTNTNIPGFSDFQSFKGSSDIASILHGKAKDYLLNFKAQHQ